MANHNPDSRFVHLPNNDGHLEPSEPEITEDVDTLVDQYGVGIDTHSRFIQVCVFVQSENQILRYEREFTTDWTDLTASRQWILEVIQQHYPEIHSFHYTIESTGTYHFPVLRALKGAPRVMNPLLAGATKRKTDALDARLLAHHDITGLWNESFLPGDDMEILRCIVKHCAQKRREATRFSNRIGGFLLRFGHTITSYSKIGSAYTQSIIEDMIQGKVPDAPGVCADGLIPEAQKMLDCMLKDWKQAADESKMWVDYAQKYCKSLDFANLDGEVITGKKLLRLLQTVPGIGPQTAMIWCSQIVWPGRFPSAKHCVAYCGLDPTLKVSAGKVTNYSRRGGNKMLHRALTMAAGSLISRKKEPFGQWGYRMMKSKSKGGYKKACGAVARRLAYALYHIHAKGEPFSYQGYNFWRQKEVKQLTLEEMELGRFEPILKRLGLTTSQEVADAYFTTLASEKGIGEKCLKAVQQWITSNQVGSTPVASSSDARKRKSVTRLYRKLPTASSAGTE